MAKAQNLEEINEIMQFFQIANSLGPGGVAELKPDAIATYIGDKLGVPSNLRTSPEEKQAIIQQSMAMFDAQAKAAMEGQAPQQETPPPQEQEPASAVEEEVSA